jgi:curved DNA-binding protein
MAVKFQDYYKTLGVSRTASQDEISKAYRKLARKFHPDVNKDPNAEEKFKQIGEAYAVLKDPETRRRYDQLGADWRSGQDFTPPPGWQNVHFDFGGGGPGAAGFDFGEHDAGGFSEFFRSIFGGGRGGVRTGFRTAGRGSTVQPQWAARGQDHEAEITVTLDDAYHGAKKRVAFEVTETDARGQLKQSTKSYEVTIPKGITDGGRIRLAGQGGKAMGAAKAGDLYLRVRIAPHPVFRMRDHDLECDLPVTPWEAALGSKVMVPTLDGPVTMTLPPGTSSGKRMRLRGKGLPRRGSNENGDLYAEVKIVVPETLPKKERELFEELSKVSKFNPRR